MDERKVEVRKPLFDRLVDRDPRPAGQREVGRPQRTLDRRGLRESVRLELERLFNTRCPLPAHRLADRPRSVIDYGVPELTGFSARNVEDRERLAEVFRRAVEAFEPRLEGVRIQLEPVPGDDLSLAGYVEGLLRTDNVPEPVSFGVAVETRTGKVGINGGA
ncbi:MAG TPA: type VI secretion system baseplate subunit TssE [Thermoanaerobaculia bacterium]|jgi:type VI secretion system lysozyme-like protein|nr:type VI secretion system baseplate subunit TssE [Thermoanaerobaculia bacterium]